MSLIIASIADILKSHDARGHFRHPASRGFVPFNGRGFVPFNGRKNHK